MRAHKYGIGQRVNLYIHGIGKTEGTIVGLNSDEYNYFYLVRIQDIGGDILVNENSVIAIKNGE